ncbi:GNAT family N-acetyltransferase [Halocatena salina]|uniref:GNAT family N-acetyltransferase n=1 Tax=Halocatena salina TaxID=2934340 RepID=A0A8T9ZZF3_9EURY|nr:N-acetyltransferase [Halocatena salina]UPM42170.1 GNAT family N-acetyltransferase [Halocatena salina]
MSVNVERCTVRPGQDTYGEAAWELKEQIRRAEGVLKQRHGFFADAYRRSTVYCYVTETEGESETLIGFAAVRRDGYILFLAVASEFRGDGFGRRLIGTVAENYNGVSCHARTTNESALQFYEHLGFEIERRVSSYYEDGGDAYYLRLGEDGLADKISRFVGL